MLGYPHSVVHADILLLLLQHCGKECFLCAFLLFTKKRSHHSLLQNPRSLECQLSGSTSISASRCLSRPRHLVVYPYNAKRAMGVEKKNRKEDETANHTHMRDPCKC
jgi:hypothetical protein